jgi:membrane protease YdiL (CAAX protease family)
MDIDMFLWPMLLPMLLPLVYCAKYKKEARVEIVMISVAMVLIVFLYWPLMTMTLFSPYSYIAVKFLLFVVLPIVIFVLLQRNASSLHLSVYGIKKEGVKKSIVWCVLFLPIMLVTTGIIHYFHGVSWDVELIAGLMSLFEAFTEEFFFRGILFVFLLKKTTMKVAYVTSLTSFILMHPQNLTTFFIIGTIVQGFLTIEIARRSQNIVGSWLLHGSNRFFQLVLLPLFF